MYRTLRILCGVLLCLALPGAAVAQRSLYWDTLDVTAHLDAGGELHVTETQTIVNLLEFLETANKGRCDKMTPLSGRSR